MGHFGKKKKVVFNPKKKKGLAKQPNNTKKAKGREWNKKKKRKGHNHNSTALKNWRYQTKADNTTL